MNKIHKQMPQIIKEDSDKLLLVLNTQNSIVRSLAYSEEKLKNGHYKYVFDYGIDFETAVEYIEDPHSVPKARITNRDTEAEQIPIDDGLVFSIYDGSGHFSFKYNGKKFDITIPFSELGNQPNPVIRVIKE